MGYEIDKIEKMELYNRTTGEKIGEFEPPITSCAEEILLPDEAKVKLHIPKEVTFAATIATPSCPNIKMIISPGDQCGDAKAELYFYRHKYYNWFQRLMYKICFGITIKQGDEVEREFI